MRDRGEPSLNKGLNYCEELTFREIASYFVLMDPHSLKMHSVLQEISFM